MIEKVGLLALSHSARSTNLERCSVQFLGRRFGDPGRLASLPPFETLPPPDRLYSGALSLYRVTADGAGRLGFQALGSLRSEDKLQQATLDGRDRLLVGFEHRLERWRLPGPIADLARIAAADVRVEARFEHPHLAGLHTAAPLAGGRAVAACAAADAVLVVDLERGSLERLHRLPAELYGRNYPLDPEMDLRRHYVHDGVQTTHVNAASPDRGRRWVAVSTLIQGAIGVLDLATGRYLEVTRGFVGCHGARFDDRERLYFADSATGCLVVLDDAGRIARRFAVGSRWLHDVQQIRGSAYAFALADRNELQVRDVDSGELLFRARFPVRPDDGPDDEAPPEDGGWLGNSAQALSYVPFGGAES